MVDASKVIQGKCTAQELASILDKMTRLEQG